MIINREKLVSLLVRKTGSGREQIEEQLSRLINRIQSAAEEGKTFEIENFGTFSLQDGQLQFNPDDVLQTEINNKYAGMKPIELMGAFKGADEAEEIPVDDQSFPPTEETKSASEIEKERWSFDETSADEQARIEKAIFGKTFKEEPKEPRETEPEKSAAIPEIAEQETDPAPGNAEPAPPMTDNTSEEKDTIGKVLTLTIVVLVVGVLGWLIYDIGFSGNTNNGQPPLPAQGASEQTQTKQINLAANESVQEAADQTSEPEPPAEVITVPDVSSPQEQQNQFGLHGELNDAVKTGYTIVVHSLNLQRANAIKEQLHADGFRVMILEARVNGNNYYRVGLGQFPTLQAAQQAINQLPDRYKNDNFIKRF